MRVRRRFVDWNRFMAPTGRYRQHYLLLGSKRTAFDSCCKVSLADLSDHPYPISSLCRPYLRELVRLQATKPNRVEVVDKGLYERHPPTYYAGHTRGELALVDLVAAYWQLYAPTSLDLAYEGEGLPRNGTIRFLGADELGEHKGLRNTIVGIARAEYRTIVDFGRVERVPVGLRWQRPGLWAFLQDMLEAVAWEMRLLFGAVHIHTDGYVLPHPDLADDAVGYLADRWGLTAEVRARGEGEVRGLGSWMIGETTIGERTPDTGPLVDTMGQVVGNPDLRRWYLEAKAHRSATKSIYCKKLDEPVQW